MDKINRILLAVALALAAVLAVLLWQNEQETRAKQAYITAYTDSLNPLTALHTGLQNRLNNLQRAYATEVGGTGTLTLLCLAADEQVYTTLYPALQAHGFTATLVLLPDALPGAPGCMSLEEFLLLCADGWQPCLAWDGTTDLDEWLGTMQAWFAESGADLAMPQAVYLPPTCYATDLDAALLAHGFTTILHHGEDDLDLITQTAADPWRVGAAGWNAPGASDQANILTVFGGATAFEVGFDPDDEGTLYDATQFAYMLNRLTAWQKNGSLFVTDLPGARAARTTAGQEQSTLQRQYETEKQPLEQQLADLEDEIAEIEAAWHWEP